MRDFIEYIIALVITMFLILFLYFYAIFYLYDIPETNKIILTPTPAPTITVTPFPTVMAMDYLNLPDNIPGTFKPYEDYNSINDKESKQYCLQQLCSTDLNGFRRFKGYYTVAMGAYYAKWIGQSYIVTLSTGKEIRVMIGDFKQKKHTDKLHQYGTGNNDIIEFIVDEGKLPECITNGDVSPLGLQGSIIKIREE